MKLNLLFLSFALCVTLEFSSAIDAQQWPVEIVRSNTNGWISPGNFDNDNDIDFLILNGDSLFWYENLQPGWSVHLIDAQFFNASWADIFDMDLDGDLDVLQLSGSPDTICTIAWNENIMNGTQWIKHTIKDSITQPSNMTFEYGDIDGDSDIDIAVAFLGDGTISWFENIQGDTIWQEHKVAKKIGGLSGIWTALADIDHDNDLDIIGSGYDSGKIIWYENQLPNTIWTPHPIATLPGTVQSFSADMDNDGDLDIITHSNISNVLLWYENPTWDEHLITSGIASINIGPVGDIDQDGFPDVSFGSQNNIGWCKNLGDAASWKIFMIDTLNNKYPLITGLSDINGDKFLDLTVYIINPPTLFGEARWYANPYSTTGVKDISNGLPNEFNLSQNYPNPFNPSTTIKYSLPVGRQEFQNVKLKIYNILGREVTTLLNQKQKPGNYEVTWDAGDQPSGVYFYKLQTGDFTQTKKMILLR